MRRNWLKELISNAIDEGVYSPEADPAGIANLIMSIWIGLRLGRLLWGEDFNADATLQALFLMHSGRLTQPRPKAAVQTNGDPARSRRASAAGA